MAQDKRFPDRERGERARDEHARRAEWRERETSWQGDDSFGAGWGNQTAAHDRREADERSFFERGPRELDSGLSAGGPGFANDFADTQYRRAEFGRRRGQVGDLSGGGHYGFGNDHRDPHYAEWRNREIAALDRDYDEYRRENQSRFDREFGAWRDRRGEQRQALERVNEHMEVLGSDGEHVGKVDCVRGDHIVLTKSDAAAGGVHHSIPCGWIAEVGNKVKLNLTANEAKESWRAESRSRALFEREDSGTRGPHMLNRAFSGTYPKGR